MSDNRHRIMLKGAAGLREFGYPNCTHENILTDQIYRAFFLETLKDASGHSDIDALIEEIKAINEDEQENIAASMDGNPAEYGDST